MTPVVEWAAAVIFAALGVRSVRFWLRVQVDLQLARHHVLFALFIAARSGVWFSLAGLFAIFATRGTVGRAFSDDVRPYLFLAIVPLILALVSVASMALLAIGTDEEAERRDETGSAS